MQIMIQACAKRDQATELKKWSLDTLGPGLLSSGEKIEHLIINHGLPAPANGPYGSGEVLDGDPFDLIIQIWVPDKASFDKAFAPYEEKFRGLISLFHFYRLTDTEVVNKFPPLTDKPTPGYKLIRGLFLHEDLPDPAAKRMWAHHSNLAVKVHIGMARYARHWVDEILTPGSPNIRGLSDLHFPSEEAMRDQYFDSPRGRDEIWHDIAHFISGGTQRFYGQEFILR